jgi:hypothetical protein
MIVFRFHPNREDLRDRLSMLERKKNLNLMLSKLFLLFEPAKTTFFLILIFFNISGLDYFFF